MPDREKIEAVVGDLSRNWGWLLGLGIVFVILGTVGVAMSVLVTLVSVVYFGIMLMIGGSAQLIHSFKGTGWKGVLPSAITGLLYLVAGFSVIRNPVVASSLLTVLLAGVLIAIGLMRVWMAVQHRGSRHWIWPLIGGLATAVFGVVILVQWPVSGTWVIGLILAVDLIINGWSCIAIALAARNVAKTVG